MCGPYTVVESWLSDQADSRGHGRVRWIYTLVVLSAMAAGQSNLDLAYGDAAKVFAVISILTGCATGCAIISVSLPSSLAPTPVPATRIAFLKLYRRSHTAFAGALGSRIVIGTFWKWGAVHVVSVKGSAEFAPTFMAASILGGTLVLYPVGIASDLIDRRQVLTLLSAMSSLTAFYLSSATDTTSLLFGAAAFGAASNSLCAVSLVKAADNLERDELIMIGSSVLLLNAAGAAIGSFVFGWAMRSAKGKIPFKLMAIACALFAAFIAIQPKGPTAVATYAQSSFVPATSTSAPTALQQDPRTGDIAEKIN